MCLNKVKRLLVVYIFYSLLSATCTLTQLVEWLQPVQGCMAVHHMPLSRTFMKDKLSFSYPKS